MTTIKPVILAMAVLITIPFASAKAQSENFETGKMMEIQAAVLRTLDAQYVDSVKLGSLIQTGINAMLETLDPYTVFIPEENEEDLDIMTTGSYGGVGSIIKKTAGGSIIISEPYSGSPAVKSGLQPGDTIIEVDGDKTKDLTIEECSSRMRGTAGTGLTMKVIKVRTGDTAVVNIVRERIHVSDVNYSGFINDTTGYIQISGFTLDGSKDVKKALLALKENPNLKRLVLDLRGNGGGLMSEAIDIVSLFVPKGTMVVSAKGKLGEVNDEYYTQNEPIDTEIPLLVMVNSGSASSSEIVTGALQDLDRATIAGTRTFGKGLVQSIRGVGYNTSLKLTTAKYYTPSGRCVQAIDYSHRNEDGSVGTVPDSLRKEFKTAGGRSVYDGGGIEPDIKVEPKYYTRPLMALVYSDIMNDYALNYYAAHTQIPSASEFRMNDKEYDGFVSFAAEREFDSRTETQIEMEDVLRTAKREELSEDITGLNDDIDALLKKVSLSKKEYLVNNKDEIKPLVENEIAVKYYYQWGSAESALRNDTQLKEAISKWTSLPEPVHNL